MKNIEEKIDNFIEASKELMDDEKFHTLMSQLHANKEVFSMMPLALKSMVDKGLDVLKNVKKDKNDEH